MAGTLCSAARSPALPALRPLSTRIPGLDPPRPILAALGGGAAGRGVPVIGNHAERDVPRLAGFAPFEHRVARMRRAHLHQMRYGLFVRIGREPDTAGVDDDAAVIQRDETRLMAVRAQHDLLARPVEPARDLGL